MSRLGNRLRDLAPAARHHPVAASAFGPDSVQVYPRHLRVGEGYAATLVITGYPAEVTPGWLEPLLTYPGRLDVSLHVEPVPPAVAADRLRRQRARLESGRRRDYRHGRLDDPDTEAAAEDAAELAHRVARGEGKLFRVALVITVHAADEDELSEQCGQVRALASSLLVDTHPTTFRAVQGWASTLPLGQDLLGQTRTFDTAALAAAFPFTSPDMPTLDPLNASTDGVFYGLNLTSGSVVVWDRWAQDNYNSVTIARSGAGKSYHTKLDLLRQLYQGGVQAAVIDPEDEYRRLAQAVGGAYLHLGRRGVRLNPLDLPPEGARAADELSRRALFCHTLVAVMLGTVMAPEMKAALDRAIGTAYQHAGFTADPRTWNRPAPLLRDVADALSQDSDPVAVHLAGRLAPYVTGSFRGLFEGPTTVRPDGHLVVFSLKALPDELKAVGTLLTLDAIWRRITDSSTRRRRLVVVDEAWLLLKDGDGARFLYRLAKSARKYWTALAVVTQDAADVLGSDLGRAVIANSATQILLRQAPQAIEQIVDAFNLSGGERAFLLSADRGEGLLASGLHRVPFRALASSAEHSLITTDPAELAELDDA